MVYLVFYLFPILKSRVAVLRSFYAKCLIQCLAELVFGPSWMKNVVRIIDRVVTIPEFPKSETFLPTFTLNPNETCLMS